MKCDVCCVYMERGALSCEWDGKESDEGEREGKVEERGQDMVGLT
jgi:hypothetical protein